MRKLLKWMGEWVFALFGGGGAGVRPVRECEVCRGYRVIHVAYWTTPELARARNIMFNSSTADSYTPHPRPVPCPYCGGKGTVRHAD